eukprot:364475-Chlamydomonas_euryale.AAC.12
MTTGQPRLPRQQLRAAVPTIACCPASRWPTSPASPAAAPTVARYPMNRWPTLPASSTASRCRAIRCAPPAAGQPACPTNLRPAKPFCAPLPCRPHSSVRAEWPRSHRCRPPRLHSPRSPCRPHSYHGPSGRHCRRL